jgi:hypothetical protein
VVPGPVDVTVWSPDRPYQVLTGAFRYVAPGSPIAPSTGPSSGTPSGPPSTDPPEAATATNGSGSPGGTPSDGPTATTASPTTTPPPDLRNVRLRPVSVDDATIPDWMWHQPGCGGRCTTLTV